MLSLQAVERIASRRNPLVLRCRAAARGDDPALLLDGQHLVHEALSAGLSIPSVLVLDDALARNGFARLSDELRERGARVFAASAAVMAAASPVRSASPIVALAHRPAVAPDGPYRGETPVVLIACDVQDPGNLGAVIRVAEAAGASGVVTAGTGADPFSWKALRGSMGSALRLPVCRHGTAAAAVEEARRHGCRIVAAVPRGGTSLFEADLTGALALLFGGEGAGLDPALVEGSDVRVSIPMQPPVESLNAAVAAALVAYEATRRRSRR